MTNNNNEDMDDIENVVNQQVFKRPITNTPSRKFVLHTPIKSSIPQNK